MIPRHFNKGGVVQIFLLNKNGGGTSVVLPYSLVMLTLNVYCIWLFTTLVVAPGSEDNSDAL